MGPKVMKDALCDPQQKRWLGKRWLAVCLGAILAGCAPPPPETAEVTLSVEMPDEQGNVADQLSDSSIQPPDLETLNAHPATFRNDTESRPAGPEKRNPAPADTVAHQIPGPDGPEDYSTWPKPDLVLVVTGQQHGYIEPCGCTGLDKQKGGVARRLTFLKQLQGKGWELLPVDAGNQVRRTGRQAEIKLQQTAKALKTMDYQVVGFGPDDLRLGVGELLAVAAGEQPEDAMFVSANVVLVDPELMPQQRVIERGGMKIGVTTVLDPEKLEVAPSDEILVHPVKKSAVAALKTMETQSPDFRVLLYFGTEETARKLALDVPGFDLIVVGGDYGEPTYRAEPIEGSQTKLILTGNKGMYAGLVGLYAKEEMKYARVPLTHEFADAPEMRQLMKDYQSQLRDVGLASLGLKPIPHPSGRKFVGSKKCGECHTEAFKVWKGTAHVQATEHIVRPPKERGDVARHFDPECLSCHVTGWNPQNYYPYDTGYLSLEGSAHLTGNGCENCHGPGAEHSAAELANSGVGQDRLQELREQMKLSYEDARQKCLECHDIDNSPDFHEEDAFEDTYWPDVEHYGID
ncbi:MAG: hypothetical protein MI861_22950 [Pirellulales bacterium]|nr:hypothetical protein [Pirellulales bacterium]